MQSPHPQGSGFGEGLKAPQGHPRVRARQMQSLHFPWGQSVCWDSTGGAESSFQAADLACCLQSTSWDVRKC